MTIDATAQALAGNEPAPIPATPETDDDGLSAAFDKFNVTDEHQTENEPEASVEEPAPEGEEAKPEATQGDKEADAEAAPSTETEKAEKPPSELPYAVREHWKDIPEAARESIAASQRKMAADLANTTRQFKAVEPIRDELVRAIRENPALAALTPQQMAQEVNMTARMSANFRSKPVETLLTIARENGIEAKLLEALNGRPAEGQQAPQPQDAALIQKLQNEIASLKQAADPNHLRQTFDAHLSQRSIEEEVQKFASTAEHWQLLEPHMMGYVQGAMNEMPEGTPHRAILEEAYKRARNELLPGAKAQVETVANTATATADPARTEAAKRAISANVKGGQSGKTRELSEEEVLGGAYERAARR